MDGGEVQRKQNVIVNPENWKEMKEKYIEREEEQIKKILEKKKVQTKEELEKIAALSVASRARRAAPEHKSIKDHTIQVEAKSTEIQELKKKLHEEITAVAKSHFPMPASEEKQDLKGRISVRSENRVSGKEEQD